MAGRRYCGVCMERGLTNLEVAGHAAAHQEKWIRDCGGDLAGYQTRYGADRGRLIYEADAGELEKHRAALAALKAKAAK